MDITSLLSNSTYWKRSWIPMGIEVFVGRLLNLLCTKVLSAMIYIYFCRSWKEIDLLFIQYPISDATNKIMKKLHKIKTFLGWWVLGLSWSCKTSLSWNEIHSNASLSQYLSLFNQVTNMLKIKRMKYLFFVCKEEISVFSVSLSMFFI
jgi:hypothetical protein